MRLQVPAGGVTALLLVAVPLAAGCFGPVTPGAADPGGWRVFDSAFDGLENARLVETGAPGIFNFTFEGASPYGHKAFYEESLPAGETIRLAFRAQVGPQAKLRLAHVQQYVCDDASTQPRPANATVDDAWASGWVLRAPGECVFHLTLRRDVVAENGVHLVWEATTIAFDARDRGPGGGAPLVFQAQRI